MTAERMHLPPSADPLFVAVVLDTPAPQGSKRHVGKGIMVESSAKVQPWREAVKGAIYRLHIATQPAEYGPVRLDVMFTLKRPKAHYRTGRNAHLLRDGAPPFPIGPPDVDKLLRSTLDAIVAAGVIHDDAQIVDTTAAKRYPGTHVHALDRPGALIRMWRL